MKKDLIQGYFLIITAIVGPVVTWMLTSKKYKIQIETIRDNSINKETISDTYIEKNKYEYLKEKEVTLVDNATSCRRKVDSLSKELRYIKVKYGKISNVPNPVVKLEVDKSIYEIEKAYRSGKYIVVDIRIINLGNDKKGYGLDKYKTVVKTDDGAQFEVKKILKGGNETYKAKGNLFNKEEVFYSLYFGDVSSQLKYDLITFRSLTTDKSAILERINLSN